jgi:hypothetical protein
MGRRSVTVPTTDAEIALSGFVHTRSSPWPSGIASGFSRSPAAAATAAEMRATEAIPKALDRSHQMESLPGRSPPGPGAHDETADDGADDSVSCQVSRVSGLSCLCVDVPEGERSLGATGWENVDPAPPSGKKELTAHRAANASTGRDEPFAPTVPLDALASNMSSGDLSFDVSLHDDADRGPASSCSAHADRAFRNAEALWNEQVIKQAMEEPPSFQLRIIDALSSKKRQKQRTEQDEIAKALALDAADSDVVMFQRQASLSSGANGVIAPVVAFDVIQEEEDVLQEILRKRERGGDCSSTGEGPRSMRSCGKRPGSPAHPLSSLPDADAKLCCPEPLGDEAVRNAVPRLSLRSPTCPQKTSASADDKERDASQTAGSMHSATAKDRCGYEEFLQKAEEESPRSRTAKHRAVEAPVVGGSLEF